MAAFRLIVIWGSILILSYVAWSLTNIRTAKDNTENLWGFSYSKSLIAENRKLFETLGPKALPETLNTIEKNTSEILASAPLNSDALLHSAILTKIRRKGPINVDILSQAKNRDPRKSIISIYMINAAQISGNVNEIFEPLDLLFRLRPKEHPQYYTILSGLFENPSTRPQIEMAIKSNPIWAYQFLLRKIQTTSASQLESLGIILTRYMSEGYDAENNRRLNQFYIKRLLDIQEYRQAYDYWENTLPKENKFGGDYPGLFNDQFEKLTIAPPFNWLLTNTPDVVTEMNVGGGLYVSFNGGNPTVVARQSFLWPNTHEGQLTINGRYQAKRKQGRFDIRVQCQQTGTISANILLSDLGDLALSPTAKIPPIEDGCEMAELLIIGRPDIFAERISLTLHTLDLTFQPASAPLTQEEVQ